MPELCVHVLLVGLANVTDRAVQVLVNDDDGNSDDDHNESPPSVQSLLPLEIWADTSYELCLRPIATPERSDNGSSSTSISGGGIEHLKWQAAVRIGTIGTRSSGTHSVEGGVGEEEPSEEEKEELEET